MPVGSRKPINCPQGLSKRYTVKPQDSMVKIARTYNISLQSLVEANPHIPHPNLIAPGDILCVPVGKNDAYSVMLEGIDTKYPYAVGAALVSDSPRFDRAVSIVAILPPLKDVGEKYKSYQAYLMYTTQQDNRAVSKLLYQVPENPNTWATTIDLTKEDVSEISQNATLVVSAATSERPEKPPGDLILLKGILEKIQ